MTTALVLKSGVTGNCYAPFGSGGGVGDRPADHNYPALPFTHEISKIPVCTINNPIPY